MLTSYLKDYLEDGGDFDGYLLVKSCDVCISSNGGNYLNATLQDVSASISARKWSIEQGDKELFSNNNIIRVVGKIFKYKNVNQLKIEEAYKVDKKSLDLNDFYPSCPCSDKELEEDLNKMINLIEDEDIKKLVSTVILENKEKYMTYPAAISIHHAYKGGICYHSLSIAKNALSIANNYPQLNKDYLIAGSLLHDIGKTVEMNGINSTSYTLQGNLEGHISIGAEMVKSCGEKIHTPEFKLTVIVHMILSHHGSAEFGSPIPPRTPEAFVLHLLDEMDAKLFVLNNALKDLNVGDFSNRLLALDNLSFLKTK